MMQNEGVKNIFYSAKNELYSHKGKYFHNTLIAIVVMVVLIGIFGVVYEMLRKRKCGQTGKNITPEPVEMLTK